MALSRRNFLKLVGGSSAGAAILAACRPQVQDFLIQSPVRMPEDMVTGVDNWYASRCAECGAGCGVVVRVVEGRAKKVEGNPEHPLNMGKLCLRGHGSVQAVYHVDRIRRPMMAVGGRGSGRFEEITWDKALDELVGRLKQARGAATSLVLATDPIEGHLALVASRFTKAYGNAVHAQYEPMDSTVLAAATEKVFGSPQLPDFDIANAKSILSFGADFLMGWVSQVRHSLAYGEFRQGEGRERGYFVHIDTRFGGTAANADEWVPVKPGSEGKLALSIAYVIVHEGKGNLEAARQLFGSDPERALDAYKPSTVAAETGVPAERIQHIALEFAARQPGVAIGGGSAGAHTNGLFNLTAIYALNHLVGSVGQKGGVVMNPPSPLAADPAFRDVPVGRYAATPLAEWERILERMRGGQVSALLVRNADLVYGLPSALRAKEALDKVPFIASFSSFLDDTTYYADLVLPSHLPLEDWGESTAQPGSGYQAITFQQPVIRPFLETRGFADVLLAVSQELGMEKELPWPTFRDLLRESAQKLYQSDQGPATAASFEAFWNETLRKGGWWRQSAVAGGPSPVPQLDLEDPGAKFEGGDLPYVLVPFQPVGIGDGRSAHLPWMQGAPDPVTSAAWTTWVEINSKDAGTQGLKEGDVVRLDSG
ncbi:MAG: molybdopterin oxidoreductase, partial [Dehalococcoidia bacterium]|nr:molybdopterin oxidoreductase [Dehalococcoidia bacterium]